MHKDSDQKQFYLTLFIAAPIPREPSPREKTFRQIDEHGNVSDAKDLPCWRDGFSARKDDAANEGEPLGNDIAIEGPEVFMSLVVPAYNEEERIEIMLTEAVEYLQMEYGDQHTKQRVNDELKDRKTKVNGVNGHTSSHSKPTGWEVLVISDGSTDKTIDTVLNFARNLGKDASSIRVVSLQENRGKGGAVTHGMRHVRGEYAVFADADGASKFEDLGKLLRASKEVEDADGRGVAVGSRAHLVGSEAVVRVGPTLADCVWSKFLTCTFSVHFCAIYSCTPFTCCFGSLHHQRQLRFEIPSVDSNFSLAPRYLILYLTCIARAGSLMSRC